MNKRHRYDLLIYLVHDLIVHLDPGTDARRSPFTSPARFRSNQRANQTFSVNQR